eukprot:scaffold166290_cov20-Prasinocladus_malaysianus.AAC.1
MAVTRKETQSRLMYETEPFNLISLSLELFNRLPDSAAENCFGPPGGAKPSKLSSTKRMLSSPPFCILIIGLLLAASATYMWSGLKLTGLLPGGQRRKPNVAHGVSAYLSAKNLTNVCPLSLVELSILPVPGGVGTAGLC